MSATTQPTAYDHDLFKKNECFIQLASKPNPANANLDIENQIHYLCRGMASNVEL